MLSFKLSFLHVFFVVRHNDWTFQVTPVTSPKLLEQPLFFCVYQLPEHTLWVFALSFFGKWLWWLYVLFIVGLNSSTLRKSGGVLIWSLCLSMGDKGHFHTSHLGHSSLYLVWSLSWFQQILIFFLKETISIYLHISISSIKSK